MVPEEWSEFHARHQFSQTPRDYFLPNLGTLNNQNPIDVFAHPMQQSVEIGTALRTSGLSLQNSNSLGHRANSNS